MHAASPSISRRSGPRFGPLWILLGLLGSAPAAAGPGEVPAADPAADPAAALAAQLRAWQPLRAPVEPPRIQESDVRAALAGATVKGVVTVEGVAAGKAYGMRVFDVPVEVAWKAVTDDAHRAEHMPVSDSRIVRGAARTHDHLLYQYLPVPLFTDRWWITRIRYNSALYQKSGGLAWEMYFSDAHQDPTAMALVSPETLGDSIPLAWTKGAWLLVKLDEEHTFGAYYIWSDPGGNFPAGPASRFSAITMGNTVDAMGRIAEGHAKTCNGTFIRPDGQPL